MFRIGNRERKFGEKGMQEYGTYDFPRDELLPSRTFGRFANPSSNQTNISSWQQRNEFGDK